MRWCEAWLAGLLNEPSWVWVENARTQVRALPIDETTVLPITINDTEWDNSYVCSPYTAFVSYAREELARLKSPPLEAALRIFIGALDGFLRWGRINRVIHVNNWLLSTNLYPPWDGQGAEDLHCALRSDYPDHTILFRSLNKATNALLMKRLETLGYRLIPSRQVYVFDYRRGALRLTQNARWDRRLLKDRRGYSAGPVVESDYPRIVELYNLLYLDKYSQHNPHFSRQLIALWHRSQEMTLVGLRHPGGRLDGVVGILRRGEVTTVPLVGYDTALPQSLGLYRRLMAIAMEDAERQHLLLNLSAGASHFKRLRGGQPYLEYSAAYYRHLPPGRRVVWGLLDASLSWLGAPLMRRFKL